MASMVVGPRLAPVEGQKHLLAEDEAVQRVSRKTFTHDVDSDPVNSFQIRRDWWWPEAALIYRCTNLHPS